MMVVRVVAASAVETALITNWSSPGAESSQLWRRVCRPRGTRWTSSSVDRTVSTNAVAFAADTGVAPVGVTLGDFSPMKSFLAN